MTVNDRDCKSFKKKLEKRGVIIKKLGSGSTGITFSYCGSKPYCTLGSRKTVKLSRVSRQSKKKTQPEIDYEINRELMKLMKYTPHINRVYSQIKCSFFQKLLENQSDDLYKKFLEWSVRYKINEGDPIVITKMELGHYDLFDHTKYIRTLDELKEIVFQIVYTLAVIQYYNKGFKHGDLKEDNVLVYDRSSKPEGYLHYTILGKTYRIKNNGDRVKLIDFDFSASDKTANCRQPPVADKLMKPDYKALECSKRLREDSRLIGLTSNYKPHYDLFYLLNRLSSVFYTKQRNPEFNEYLSRLIPSKYQGQNVEIEGRKIVDDWRLVERDSKKIAGVMSPVELLMSGAFDDLLSGSSVSKVKKPVKHYNSRITSVAVKAREDLFV